MVENQRKQKDQNVKEQVKIYLIESIGLVIAFWYIAKKFVKKSSFGFFDYATRVKIVTWKLNSFKKGQNMASLKLSFSKQNALFQLWDSLISF